MSDALKSAPKNWKCRLVLPAVPRDGSQYEDEFALSLDNVIDYWGQIYRPFSQLGVKVEAFRTGGRIVADISVRVEIEAQCSRCLNLAREMAEGSLRYIFSTRRDECGEKGEESGGEGKEEIILIDSWEDEIDLAQMVWEALITALPAALLCSPECRGLCPQCGANLNEGLCSCKSSETDPRFDVLREFMQNQ